MSLFWRGSERRSVTYQDVWGSGASPDLGIDGSAEGTYSRLIALYAAHRFLVDQFSTLPLHAYRRLSDGSRERLPVQPRLLTAPAPGVTPVVWRSQLIASLVSWGNAYGLITRTSSAGWPEQCVWMDPSKVYIDESGARPRYFLRGAPIPDGAVLHIPWIVQPGKWRALSPIGAFRAVWETGAAAQNTAREWFKGGAIPSGHLKNTIDTLDNAEAAAAKERYRAAVANRDVLVTGNDWDYSTIGVPADEARFIEGLRLTATQIANIYGIPPEKIGGERGSSMTYSTVLMDQLAVQVETLAPWCVRVEDALTAQMPRPQYVAFNLDAQLRADPLTRAQAILAQEQAGTLTNDEARALEDRAPLTAQERTAWLQAFRGVQQDKPTSTREQP